MWLMACRLMLDKVFDERLETMSESSAPQTYVCEKQLAEKRQAQAQKTWIRG